jgi:hypothetical protein
LRPLTGPTGPTYWARQHNRPFRQPLSGGFYDGLVMAASSQRPLTLCHSFPSRLVPINVLNGISITRDYKKWSRGSQLFPLFILIFTRYPLPEQMFFPYYIPMPHHAFPPTFVLLASSRHVSLTHPSNPQTPHSIQNQPILYLAPNRCSIGRSRTQSDTVMSIKIMFPTPVNLHKQKMSGFF